MNYPAMLSTTGFGTTVEVLDPVVTMGVFTPGQSEGLGSIGRGRRRNVAPSLGLVLRHFQTELVQPDQTAQTDTHTVTTSATSSTTSHTLF